MGLATRQLHDKAVLWMANGNDAVGESTVASPVQINCRWQDNRKQGVDEKGNIIAYDATVAVDRTIEIGSILWEGELADAVGSDLELYEVVARHRVSNVKNTDTRRVVELMRYSNYLPTIV